MDVKILVYMVPLTGRKELGVQDASYISRDCIRASLLYSSGRGVNVGEIASLKSYKDKGMEQMV